MIEGYSSFPPNPPPVSIWTTRIFSAGRCEQTLERLVDVVGALHRAPHRHAVFEPRRREHPVRLDVELLLRTGLVLAFDDRIGFGKGGVDVAP